MCHLLLVLPLVSLILFLLLPIEVAATLYSFILLFCAILYWLIWKAMRRPVTTGIEGMMGAVGQFACLLNGDSYGRPTELPWAIIYTDPRSFAPLNIPLHPIEIYEMVNYFLVFLLVWRTRTSYRTDGFAFLTYLAGYGVARFSVEFFRGNPAIFAWGIPAAQVFGVGLILASLACFVLLGGKVVEPSR
jgi:hypothetical protein